MYSSLGIAHRFVDEPADEIPELPTVVLLDTGDEDDVLLDDEPAAAATE
jgi:hypothetical protein